MTSEPESADDAAAAATVVGALATDASDGAGAEAGDSSTAGADTATDTAATTAAGAVDAGSSSASEDEHGEDSEMADRKPYGNGAQSKHGTSNGGAASASNAKDPSRPRRKKARRACFACQRAHLTCGDERPCQRCIKRGLQDSCHDGMRKKAKYLHDAPTEALVPGISGSQFSNLSTFRGQQPLVGNVHSSSDASSMGNNQNAFFPSNQPVSRPPYGMYGTNPSQAPVSTVMQDFGQQQTSISPPNQTTQSNLSNLQQPFPQQPPSNQEQQQALNTFGDPLFDPSNPAFFNFDLASLNFGNRYGALEFGMLGHMSSAAGDATSADGTATYNQGSFLGGPSVYNQSPGSATYAGGQGQDAMDWQGGSDSRQGSSSSMYQNGGDLAGRGGNQNVAHGYTIGAGSHTSPSSTSSPQALLAGFESSPMGSIYSGSTNVGQSQSQQMNQPAPQARQHQHQHQLSRSSPRSGQLQHVPGRRAQGPSSIYENVNQPYAYTTGFHRLTACLQKRFSSQNTVRIAKALASIRPSFISSTKNLTREDLVFMEKCFQRTLWEYENDFINSCGTPTIVCRRTGEVAAVGKEFSILTNWKRDILLGREPNMNVNTGGTSGRSSNAGSVIGGYGGRGSEGAETSGQRPQPVFLVELLDDESVINFYEDFSKLAFGDSRGSVMSKCKLLKYKAKDDTTGAATLPPSVDDRQERGGPQGQKIGPPPPPRGVNWKSGVAHESHMNGLESEGKVECSCCWTIKRDVFDIPMLIVMNFLPCI